jgi:hypothetical protein
MDKKIILPIFITILLFLAGCAVQQQTVDSLDGEPAEIQVEEPEVQEEPEPEPEPEPVEQEPEQEKDDYLEYLSKEEQRKIKLIRNLMDEARNRQENYFFRYSDPDVLQNDVWVKGNVIKRAMIRPDEVDTFNPYNMVYLYPASGKAEAYCETTKASCPEGHGPFTETYSKWEVKTPKDWLLELGDDFTFILNNKISDQLYHIIDYYDHEAGKTTRVYINDYKGWPARVQIFYTTDINSIGDVPDERWLYDDMNIGGVSDDDVTPG